MGNLVLWLFGFLGCYSAIVKGVELTRTWRAGRRSRMELQVGTQQYHYEYLEVGAVVESPNHWTTVRRFTLVSHVKPLESIVLSTSSRAHPDIVYEVEPAGMAVVVPTDTQGRLVRNLLQFAKPLGIDEEISLTIIGHVTFSAPPFSEYVMTGTHLIKRLVVRVVFPAGRPKQVRWKVQDTSGLERVSELLIPDPLTREARKEQLSPVRDLTYGIHWE